MPACPCMIVHALVSKLLPSDFARSLPIARVRGHGGSRQPRLNAACPEDFDGAPEWKEPLRRSRHVWVQACGAQGILQRWRRDMWVSLFGLLIIMLQDLTVWVLYWGPLIPCFSKLMYVALPLPASGCARAAVWPTAAHRLRSERSRPQERKTP